MEELAQVPDLTKHKAVICAMLSSMIIGSYYLYGNINPYVSAYLRQSDPSVEVKDTLAVMPVWMLFQSVGTFLSTKLCKVLGFTNVSILAFAVFAVTNLVMTVVKDFYVFLFVYGVIGGTSIGLGYMPSLYVAWTYYPDRKASITAIVLFFSGILTAFLSPLATMIVNPKNTLV